MPYVGCFGGLGEALRGGIGSEFDSPSQIRSL